MTTFSTVELSMVCEFASKKAFFVLLFCMIGWQLGFTSFMALAGFHPLRERFLGKDHINLKLSLDKTDSQW